MADWKPNKARASTDFIEKGELAFIPVPKCMSSQMREILFADNWKLTTAPKAKIYFGIIREPVDRWIAGMAQTFYNQPKYIVKIHSGLDSFVDQAWHDPHTSKQF